MNETVFDQAELEGIEFIFKGFFKSTGLAVRLTDLETNVLAASGGQDRDTNFHHNHPGIREDHHSLPSALAAETGTDEKYHFSADSGLINATTPVFVGNLHRVNLCIGPFLFSPPDRHHYTQQAESPGFETEKHLQSLEKIPTITKEQAKHSLDFLRDLIAEKLRGKSSQDRGEDLLLHTGGNGTTYKEIFEQTPIPVQVYDLDGQLIYANHRTLDLFGIPDITHILSYNLWEEPNLSTEKANVLKQGHPVTLSHSFDFETAKEQNLFPTSRSGIIYLDVYVMPIQQSQTVTGYLVQLIEWTERKEAEEALVNSEASLREYQEIANLGSWDMDVASRWITWSDIVYRIFDMVQPAAGGFYYDDLMTFVHPDDRILIDYLYDNLATKGHSDFEYRAVRPSGEIRWIMGKGKADFDEVGNPVRMFGVLQDITERKKAETELKESRRLLKNIIDNSTNLFYSHNTDHEITFVSHQVREYLGCGPEEAMRKWTDFCTDNPINHKGFEYTRKALQTGERQPSYELEMRKKDGTRIIVEVREAPVVEDGVVTGIVGSLVDITERKKAEEAVRKFKTISEQAVHGNAIVDLEGNLLYINRAFARAHGYEPEELLGKSLSIFHTRQQMAVVDLINNELAKTGHYGPKEVWHVHKDGTEFPMLMSGTVIQGEDGAPEYLAATAIDISGQKRMEADRDRLMLAISQSSEAIVITNTEGVVEYVNPAFEATTGYSREEAIGHKPNILKSSRQDDNFYKTMWATLTAGNSWRGHLVNKKKDGMLFTEDVVISPVADAAGKTVNYLAVKRDITRELQLKAQLDQALKMEAVGRLAGGIAHDFNNMLSIIIGNSELLLDEFDHSHPSHMEIKEIQNAAERSADLTRQLLAFARKQTVAPKVLDLNATVAGMLRMLERLIGEDIDLVWAPAPTIWPVKIDPSQIDQILANLCVNARDAITDVGKVIIETSNANIDESYCTSQLDCVPGQYVILAVSDNGCGMDAAVLSNIFEPFFTTKKAGKGTGLGMAMIYGAVRQNKGFINVYSEPGEGTTIKIYLPRYVETAPPQQEPKSSPKNEQAQETILLVEDEPSILKLATKVLEKAGYTVIAAQSPERAIECAKKYEGTLDLVLTDVIMPGMNGRDLVKKILEFYPEVRCLYMSGYTANVIAHHGVLDDGVNYIQKPFSTKGLTDKLRKMFDEKD